MSSIPPLGPRYNIAPTQQVGAVRLSQPGQREFVWMRWGLVPRWAKDPSIGSQMINARSETAATKPAFRSSFHHRRCLVVADGFYEWKKVGRQKLPYRIRLKEERPFAFAGLWERWGTDEERLETCTILTTPANELLRELHDRMPVILRPADYDRWLCPSTETADLSPLLDAYPADGLVVEPANPRVNHVANDDPSVLTPPPLLF